MIKTERLILRPVEPQDVEAIHCYAGDPDIDMMMFLPNETIEQTREFVEFAVSEWTKDDPQDREFVLISEGEIIGGVNLEKVGEPDVYEIGWVLKKDTRGMGFATEAARALTEYAFRELNASKIVAHCDSRNTASEKVMKKIGMSLVDDTGTRTYSRTGVTSGEYLYAISKK